MDEAKYLMAENCPCPSCKNGFHGNCVKCVENHLKMPPPTDIPFCLRERARIVYGEKKV